MSMMKNVNSDICITVNVKEGHSTDILNSSIFHTNPAVNFVFVGMSVTVCDVSHICDDPLLRCLSRSVTPLMSVMGRY